MKMKAMMASGLAAASLMLAAGLASGPASAEDVTLKMAVPDWPPTHIMKDLFDKSYKSKSGNKVTLDVDFIPWPDYYTRLNASLTSGEKKYNMAVSDSQWLGAFIEGGYYLKINKYVDADPGLQAVFKDLHPAVKWSYSTYPYKSDQLYGFPQMPDVVISYYRKDIFCDASEQKNFMAKYKYKLPCAPEEMDAITWDQFHDIGEFFLRKKGEMLAGKPADDDFYGIEFQAGKTYDMFTTSAYEFLWQHGGDIWDETKQPNAHAVGVVNSKEAVASLQHLLSFALQLQDFCAEHPGLASYLQVLFPRGYAGRQLVAAELEALSRRGYSGDAAVLLASAVATLVISLAAREENNAGATGGEHASEFDAQRDAVDDRMTADPQLGAAHIGATQVSNAEFVRLLLAASIRGLVAEIPPGRPIGEVVAVLSAARRDG